MSNPRFFKNWKQLYTVVLLVLLLQLVIYYFITQQYTV
tara:strand:- start:1468 stop:1581 length:114 start_codon:yes stop_codon:yes gene_type:complete